MRNNKFSKRGELLLPKQFDRRNYIDQYSVTLCNIGGFSLIHHYVELCTNTRILCYTHIYVLNVIRTENHYLVKTGLAPHTFACIRDASTYHALVLAIKQKYCEIHCVPFSQQRNEHNCVDFYNRLQEFRFLSFFVSV